MSDVCERPNRQALPRRQRSIYKVHYGLEPPSPAQARPLATPSHAPALHAYKLQVAGHQGVCGTKYIGLLQCNDGTLLKPILKASQKREVDFYERVSSSSHPNLVELRQLVPKYYGCKKYTYNGFEQEYINLQDLTERMLEPCVMDVKIGRRTWDPLASPEKISREQSKYTLCRQQYAFCIPGYQLYSLAGGSLLRYDKAHGKRLQGAAVIDAFRNFLNGCSAPLCRALVLQLLAALWGVQAWARGARGAVGGARGAVGCARGAAGGGVRLYSSSVLLVYDAARLRKCCQGEEIMPRAACRPVPTRRRSISCLHSETRALGSSFSGQISSKGPVFKKLSPVPISSMHLAQTSFADPPPIHSPWTDALDRLNHNHSFDHNYEDKLSKIKMNYRAMLDQLSSDTPNPSQWGTVKIIDFAHAFFNDDDDDSIDENFKEGIDNLVSIFESFLRETDDQIL